MKVLSSARYNTPVGQLFMAEWDEKIIMCDWVSSKKFIRNQNRLRKHFQQDFHEQQTPTLQAFCRDLENYFQGTSFRAILNIHTIGTEFQKTVWNAIQNIPYGSTWTYAQLAGSIHSPSAVRAVANAVAQNHLSLIIPCHRVVGQQNPFAYAGGSAAKQFLLNLEKAL